MVLNVDVDDGGDDVFKFREDGGHGGETVIDPFLQGLISVGHR